MKSVFATLVFLLSTSNAFASNSLRCSVHLLEPLPDSGSMGLWMPPAQDEVVFDYAIGTEKTVLLTTKLVYAPPATNPDPISQYSFEFAKNTGETQMTIQFSKLDTDGQRLPGDSYGFFIYTPTEGKRNGSWSLAGATMAAGSVPIHLTDKLTGYLVLSCINRK
jgi:hypothetical protein